jgi:hypothetical protein
MVMVACLFFFGCSQDSEGTSSNAVGGSGGVGGISGSGGSGGSGASDAATGGAGGETTILFPELVLGASGTSFVSASDGTPVSLRQGISCCGGAFGWPLVDSAWIDLMSSHGLTWLHVRLGPWRTIAGGEEEWASVGGPYLESGGLAALDQWNPAFWSALENLIETAGQKGMRVEVDVADGWGLKHAQADDYGPNWPYHPWSAWNNTSGVDHVTDAGTLEIPAGGVYDAWVRKVAEHTCKYGNVTLEDGNEVSLKNGYQPAWSQSIGNVYWDECAQRNYLLAGEPHRPLLGTQSERAETVAAPQVAYSQWHRADPQDPAACGGKPCGVNEYNPDPPLPPAQLSAHVCAAEQAGTWFAYWRHGQDVAAMADTLQLIQAGCGG